MCLVRYLKSQVGQPKDEVWADLNGEVGGVLMKRLVSRSALLASRRQSLLALRPSGGVVPPSAA